MKKFYALISAVFFALASPFDLLGEELMSLDFEKENDAQANMILSRDQVELLAKGGKDGTTGIRVAYVEAIS